MSRRKKSEKTTKERQEESCGEWKCSPQQEREAFHSQKKPTKPMPTNGQN